MGRKALPPAQRAANKHRARSAAIATEVAHSDYDNAPHVARAYQYALDVVEGRTLANKWMKLACKRHLDDLARAVATATGTAERPFPYVFDVEKAEQPCRFIEMLHHVKGKWAKRRERLVLSPWQCFLVCVLFGWVRPNTRMRRFLEVYWEIPRKNGKSILAAAIGLYMFCMDDEFGAEVYSGATTEKQAWEVFGPARLMFQQSEDLRNYVGGEVWAKSLCTSRDNSRFEPIIGKPGDGSSPHCAIADEFHEHDTSDQVDTMVTGMGAREQPLMMKITTAGVNIAGPCYDSHLQACKVLEGALVDDTLFCALFGIDLPDAEGKGGDDWASPDALKKANPNYGVSVDAEWLLTQQRQAVLDPSKQNRFLTKHLNVWCSAKTAWMPMHLWGLCADPGLSIDDFVNDKAATSYLVIDLASKDDIATLLLMVKKKLNKQDHYYVFPRYYLSEQAVEAQGPNQSAYERWRRSGHVQVHDGAEIDFDLIQEDAEALLAKLRIREVPYDPWRAAQLAQRLAKAKAEVVEMRQTVQNLSTPMKEVLSAVRGGRLHHDGHPVTTWMMSNVVARVDAKDNIYPRKEKGHLKIDGPVCVIMGMARAMLSTSGGTMQDWLNATIGAPNQ